MHSLSRGLSATAEILVNFLSCKIRVRHTVSYFCVINRIFYWLGYAISAVTALNVFHDQQLLCWAFQGKMLLFCCTIVWKRGYCTHIHYLPSSISPISFPHGSTGSTQTDAMNAFIIVALCYCYCADVVRRRRRASRRLSVDKPLPMIYNNIRSTPTSWLPTPTPAVGHTPCYACVRLGVPRSSANTLFYRCSTSS